ncbi:MAG TPA: hypothetical protein VG275_13850 [Solirubrobacteraceae bacterium]|jgi:hypothetical protein|nr:hypothetical protein [Solirubrobacteraceae bacterium]
MIRPAADQCRAKRRRDAIGQSRQGPDARGVGIEVDRRHSLPVGALDHRLLGDGDELVPIQRGLDRVEVGLVAHAVRDDDHARSAPRTPPR